MLSLSLINEAFDKNHLYLYFQPIIPVKEQKNGVYYELLIRMINKAGHIILPGSLLPTAERYNLSGKIDRWVINTTFTWLKNHPQQLEKLYHCSINLSGQSLLDEGILEFIIKQLKTNKIPPNKICFEITETAAIANLATAREFIKALRHLRCRFALDDFGSGMCSFAYLRNLPVGYLKIDGAIVRNIANNPIDFAMVKAINEVGHVMEKKTIAEFVENDAILEKLRDIGVDYAQGNGISEPQQLEL